MKAIKTRARRRTGVAAVEVALSLPMVLTVLAGLWEVGRITEIQQIVWNGTREAARDASLGQDNLQTIGSSMLAYLQNAERTTFGQGHSTSMISPVVTLPANTTGYTCWDNVANQELFTITFTDMTSPSVTDPTAMSQLDLYEIGVQVPYKSITISPLAQVTGISRINATVAWASMVDSPFQIVPSLPAQ